MSATATGVQFHKITIKQFHALARYLEPDLRHELLDGQILVMTPPASPHTIVLDRLTEQFRALRHHGLPFIWTGGLRLSQTSELWPDLCLLGREHTGLQNPSAAEAKLVIEVAHTTLDYDTGKKLRAYQAAGVPEYWVVDVKGRHVLRYLLPAYQSETFAGSGTPLRPQAYPDVSIDVGALFS